MLTNTGIPNLGDRVLVKQEKRNELTPSYDLVPYQINMVNASRDN